MAEATKAQVSARQNVIEPIKVGETRIVDVAFFDANDNPAPVDGLPSFVASNPAVIVVSALPGGQSCEVTGLQTGEAEVVVFADADMSAGVRNISGRLMFNVSQLEATQVVLTPRP